MTHLYTMLYVCYIKYFYQFNKSLLYLFSGKKSLFNQFSNKYKIEEEWFKKQKKKKRCCQLQWCDTPEICFQSCKVEFIQPCIGFISCQICL